MSSYRSTPKGFLKMIYLRLDRKDSTGHPEGRRRLTFEEFVTAWKKHLSIYGMRSAWGPGPDQLDQHLPITMTVKGDGSWARKEGKRTQSNLSIDRLDSNIDYTVQNIIFIRSDENARKSSSSYEDCKIHMRLYEERFIKMKAL